MATQAATGELEQDSPEVGSVPLARWWNGVPNTRKRSVRRSLVSVVTVAVIWELLGRLVLTNRLFFAPLSAVADAAAGMWARGELQLDIATTLGEVLYGTVAAAAVGVAIGIVSGASQAFRDYTDVFLTALYATPLVAVAPLLILWLGLGLTSKVAVVFLMAVFPIIINTAAGIRNTDAALVEVARSFGATRSEIVRKVLVPSAFPFVLTGLRLAVGRAIIGAVVGELFGAHAGLGYLIFTAGQTFDVPTLFAGVLTLAFLGVLLTLGLQSIEGRAARWRRQTAED